MPELPEIETIKLQLQKVLIGQKLVIVNSNSNKTVRSDLNTLIGKKVMGVERIGKVLIIRFDPPSHKASEGLRLGFHFKMTGQLIYDPKVLSTSPPTPLLISGEGCILNNRIVGGHPTEDFVAKLPSKHTRVIFEFDNGKLYFNDQRKFGWIEINPKFVDDLGPEPFDITETEFVKRLGNSKRAIKVAIMDQSIISGVGNIYANDALWEAKINPQIQVSKLSSENLKSLFEKINMVLREGIKYGGATAINYVDLHGLGGRYQDHFRVYDRAGESCQLCKTEIIKITLGGRGTYYCPICQKR